ncbi:MAG: signal peptidase I [Candidatus Pacebacteria bacterium]|nr:signal peptidase I [Candidatus Paceibacterota bacterium]
MLKKIYKIFIYSYLALLFIVIFASINFFGKVRCFTNVSSSMTPEIEKGSIIMVQKQAGYKIGDIISYYGEKVDNIDVITHRIIDIGGNVYTTKGDANQLADRELVLPRLVIGKVVLIIPWLGYLIMLAKTYIGNFLMIILPAFIIVIVEVVKILREIYKKDKPTQINFL